MKRGTELSQLLSRTAGLGTENKPCSISEHGYNLILLLHAVADPAADTVVLQITVPDITLYRPQSAVSCSTLHVRSGVTDLSAQ